MTENMVLQVQFFFFLIFFIADKALPRVTVLDLYYFSGIKFLLHLLVAVHFLPRLL